MSKRFSYLLLISLLVLFSVSVQATSLETDGTVHTVTQGNLQFVTDDVGLMKVFKNGNFLGTVGFTLKGTVNAQQKFLNSWSTTWTWEVLSNTDSNITLLGSTSWQNLDWNQRWFFSGNTQKFSNRLTNNTGFDVTNTSFYYILRFDPTNVPCLRYIDNDARGQKYCFEQDRTITSNLSQFVKRIRFVDTVFNFQDLINSGFEFNYLFAGQLNNVHSALAGQGIIIGVTKNNGLFPAGASVELDPAIVDSSEIGITNYGNTLVRDDDGDIWTVFEAISTSADTDIFVSKSTDNGGSFTTFNITNSTDFNESLPHIDINSTGALIISFDKASGAAATTEIFVTTCSAGGCNEASEFLTDFNVSLCGIGTECSKNDLQVDQNDFAHITYNKANVGQYRRNTGFAGDTWSSEEVTNVSTNSPLSNTGIIVAKNGSDIRLAFANPNGAQVRVSYFDGTDWQADLLLVADTVSTPISGFAGYDGNFYLSYARGDSGSSPRNIKLSQCAVDANCSVIGNWSDVNVTQAPAQNDAYVSMFQGIDLNVWFITSGFVTSPDANIHLYTRLPNGAITTNKIADGNLLFNDSNQLYNPLFRNRDYRGSMIDGISTVPTDNLTLDYTFLTALDSSGDPSTLLFDSNTLADQNVLEASFVVTPASPIVLDPENSITNVRADFNNFSKVPSTIIDVNYAWSVDGTTLSTDQNITHDFNVVGDFNVSLLTVGQDGTDTFTSQSDQNILVRTAAQNIDINFSFNPTASSADINFTATPLGQVSYVWGFPHDANQTGQNILKSFVVGGVEDVCVVVTSVGDINKVKCKRFYNTHIVAKVPINLKTLVAVEGAFDMSMDTVPGQAYSQVTVDQNFWVFYGGNPDTNAFNLITDANVSFLVSTNIVKIGASDLNQTIQPYVVLSTIGIQVIFTALDSLTNNTVVGVILAFNRVVSGLGDIETSSGVTDDLGRISLPFVPNIDHNFTLEFPQGTILKTGTYNPQSTDATNGVSVTVPSISGLGDINAIGEVDINFVQDSVTITPSGLVDLNQIISSSRPISGVGITIDHNAVNLFSDTNTGAVAGGGVFGQSIDINGLSNIFPLIITVDLNFADGGSAQAKKAVTITGLDFGLESSLVNVRDDLGDLGGTMVIIAFVLALLLGILHWTFPQADNSHTYVIAAVILLFLTFVNLIDGVSWILAAIAGGAIYFSRRLDR